MITSQKAFRYGATAVVIAIVTTAGLSLWNNQPTDPVAECIKERLLEARRLRTRGHDERDAGREDAGDRLLNKAFSIENSMVPCMDLDESADNPGFPEQNP